jgi:hypothetical protein
LPTGTPGPAVPGVTSGPAEPPREVGRGCAPFDFGYVGRRAGRDHPASRISPARAEIDDPVGGGDCIEVVLNEHHGVAGVDTNALLIDGLIALGKAAEHVRATTD